MNHSDVLLNVLCCHIALLHADWNVGPRQKGVCRAAKEEKEKVS